jgi:hypothetical protein
MTIFIKDNNTYRVAGEKAIDIRHTLPAGTYVVQQDQFGAYYLEQINDFTIPVRMYGDVEKQTTRIINTFNQRTVSTGVLLTGEKGSGKSMLAKNIAVELAKLEVPTIVINTKWLGDDFNKFIQSIDQPAVVLFDEFEKVYKPSEQEQLLSLLDGVYITKKLFLFTSNDVHNINYYLLNRPGRVYYTIRYTGLDSAFIIDYCNDVLNEKTHINTICKIAMLFNAFNFDLLKALVEEMNRYNESPQEALQMLNAIPEDRENLFTVTVTTAGNLVPMDEIYDEGEWSGNPLHPYGIEVRVREYTEDREDWEYAVITMSPADLVATNYITGEFIFDDKQGNTITLTKQVNKRFNFNAIY